GVGGSLNAMRLARKDNMGLADTLRAGRDGYTRIDGEGQLMGGLQGSSKGLFGGAKAGYDFGYNIRKNIDRVADGRLVDVENQNNLLAKIQEQTKQKEPPKGFVSVGGKLKRASSYKPPESH
ncbi:hypothetical protein KC686_02190, partial [Candidatus Woesebacteria bacterium]|nr:hypothetical protein [Candidatus Woesebacteria bacterium]